MKDKTDIKVNDWVRIRTVGINDTYMVESIEDDLYTVVFKEGKYEHRMQVKLNKLEKL